MLKDSNLGPDQRPLSLFRLDQEGSVDASWGAPLIKGITPSGSSVKRQDETKEFQLYWYPSYHSEGLSAHRFIHSYFLRSPILSPFTHCLLPVGQAIQQSKEEDGRKKKIKLPRPFKGPRSTPIPMRLKAPWGGRRLPIRHEGLHCLQGDGWRMDYRVWRHIPFPEDLYQRAGPPNADGAEEVFSNPMNNHAQRPVGMPTGEREGHGSRNGGRHGRRWREGRLSGERWVEIRSIRISLALMSESIEKAEGRRRKGGLSLLRWCLRGVKKGGGKSKGPGIRQVR
ncbi:hypothetical protein BJ684DRAFT_14712 [Piptocephalis cylindrospora]|uniref:Uncharacterized protein n=1 Tax=Piptocephalis cylindrospora TaxID=1907219 RepID=A0A4P9Y7F9_9FUNG|nr:hypothetical protein BJ684DRAFT_14712 [Piptocephalis cylindrospora]|eukprot:RKP15008.1 hypothetical protein BJ684DRAFT_14712 [Piptocephalis cylindrospora]